MAPLLNCDDVPMFYKDPATDMPSSCPELCNFRYVRVRRADCLHFCPEYYYCMGRESSTGKPCASTSDPYTENNSNRLLQELPFIVVGIVVIALLISVILIMLRMLYRQKKRRRTFSISQKECKDSSAGSGRSDSGISLMTAEESYPDAGKPYLPCTHIAGTHPKIVGIKRECSDSSGCSSS